MGSQTLEILRQGVWASFTGGWFYDPRQDHESNILHLYLWLFLLCLPFSLYMFLQPVLVVWVSYAGIVGALFTTLKMVNVRLHCMFDSGECIEESSDDSNRSVSVDHNTLGSQGHGSKKEAEHIEMAVLKQRQEGETPPVQCSSRNSFNEGPVKLTSIAPAESLELIERLVRSNEFDLKASDGSTCGIGEGTFGDFSVSSRTPDIAFSLNMVDVHHRNSSGSSGGSTSAKQDHSFHGTSGGAPRSPEFGLVAEVLQEGEHRNTYTKTRNPIYYEVMGASEAQARMIIHERTSGVLSSTVRCSLQSLMVSGTRDAIKNAVKIVTDVASGSSISLHPEGHLPPHRRRGGSSFLSSGSSAASLRNATGSVELAFLSQDPSVRAAELARAAQQRKSGTNLRLEDADAKRVVRRAHSELETCPPVSGNRAFMPRSVAPPSHPVSLEAIRITSAGGLAGAMPVPRHTRRSAEFLRPPLIGDAIKPIAEQPAAETPPGSSSSTQSLLVRHRSLDAATLRRRRQCGETGGIAGNDDGEGWSDTLKFGKPEEEPFGAPLLHSGGESGAAGDAHPDSLMASTDTVSSTSGESDRSSSTHFTVIYKPLDPCSGNPQVASSPDFQELDLPEQYPGWLEGGNQRNPDPLPSPACSERSSVGGLEWLFGNPPSRPSSDQSLSDASSPSSPDEMTPLGATCRPSVALGAIPKQYLEDGNSSRVRSVLSRRLLEILNLNDPQECEVELQKLKRELDVLSTTRYNENIVTRPTKFLIIMYKQQGGKDWTRTLQIAGTGIGGPKRKNEKELQGRRERKGTKFCTRTVSREKGDCVAAMGWAPLARSRSCTDRGPPAYLLASILSTPGTHLAISHDDTSPGAVHCFQDEHGEWRCGARHSDPEEPSLQSPLLHYPRSSQHARPSQKYHLHRASSFAISKSRAKTNTTGVIWSETSSHSSSSSTTVLESPAPRGLPVVPFGCTTMVPSTTGATTPGATGGKLLRPHHRHHHHLHQGGVVRIHFETCSSHLERPSRSSFGGIVKQYVLVHSPKRLVLRTNLNDRSLYTVFYALYDFGGKSHCQFSIPRAAFPSGHGAGLYVPHALCGQRDPSHQPAPPLLPPEAPALPVCPGGLRPTSAAHRAGQEPDDF
ncbi:unnamed protein product [Ixodes persulcatus]